MFNIRLSWNKIFVRKLLTANSKYILNKPKPKRSTDSIWNKNFYISFDNTELMFDQNTRLLTVEGCFGTDKEKWAKKIAAHFAMDFVDDVPEDQMYVFPLGDHQIDLARYNELLPRDSQIYTSRMFWHDEDPVKQGRPLMLQLHYYYWRYWLTCRAMARLFNTGTGFVMKRSPWTTNVMALALKECGLMSEPAYKMFNLFRVESIPKLWRPNFIVYIKSSPEQIRENLKKKNSYLLNACNFNDRFIETYQNIMENVYLKQEADFSRIFTIDNTKNNIDDEDTFGYIMEEISKSNVNLKELDDFTILFRNWKQGTCTPTNLMMNRTYFSSAYTCYHSALLLQRIPTAMSEGAYGVEAKALLNDVLRKDERLATDIFTNSKFSSFKDTLFPKYGSNYNRYENQPYFYISHSFI